MNWKYKAFLHWFFSSLPGGNDLLYWFQRTVTKTLPTRPPYFQEIIAGSLEHINAFRAHSNHSLAEAKFYEFGAGWDLLIPLAYYAYGVQSQTLVDIRFLLRRQLINHNIELFQKLPFTEFQRRPSVPVSENLVADLRTYYGIEYRAPCDARYNDIQSGSIDCITSTNTMEHIPIDSLRGILAECHRILAKDGMISMVIDYQDHYSYFDTTISTYNFLRFSQRKWIMYNPETHYQNRLRHRDYVQLFEDADFEIVEERRRGGTMGDIEALRRLPISEEFVKYTQDELVVRGAHFVLRKRREV